MKFKSEKSEKKKKSRKFCCLSKGEIMGKKRKKVYQCNFYDILETRDIFLTAKSVF